MENLQGDSADYTLRQIRAQALRAHRHMLDHLLDFAPDITSCDDIQELSRIPPQQLLDAQTSTADWLASLGAPTAETADAAAAASVAQQAFTALATNTSDIKQKEALVALKTPSAVRHLTGMLTAYDWEFVEQAKELRGYAVSQILEETKHPDARIRLRALELLGRVTEIALFTDRVEVKKTEMSDNELDSRIKEKLSRFMGVVDASPTDANVIENKISSLPHEAA